MSKALRIVMRVFGTLLVFIGSVWFLQGINILPGSFMTGQIKWAIYGGIAFAAGIGLWVLAQRAARRTLV